MSVGNSEHTEQAASGEPYSLMGIISHWDLKEQKPSLNELVEMARGFNWEAGTGYLARMNIYLSLAQQSHENNIPMEVQERLTREVLSAERLKQFAEVFAGQDLYRKYILLGKTTLLVGIKLIALYGRKEGGNLLENEEQKAHIGEFALAINSCYGPAFGEPRWPNQDVIVQLAASSELYNPETLVYAFVRTRALIGPVLRHYTRSLKGQTLPPPFERIFTLINGLNFRDFLDITLYLHAELSKMLPELLDTGMMAYADPASPKRYVSGRNVKAWAELMAVDAECFPDLVEGSERDLSFFFDFTMFRRYPLWRSPQNRYYIIDSMFVQERLTSFGFYWAVVNGLVDEALQLSFQRLWGELVQEYVRDLMAESHGGDGARFLRRPAYTEDGTEVFDSAILIDDSLVPIEIKSAVLPIRQKYAGEASSFYEGVSAKFGGGAGAVEQLVRNIGHILSEHAPCPSSIPTNKIREIFPVIVIHEPILRFGLGTQSLADEFFDAISKLQLRDGLTIYRLQILDIETLERLQPHIQDGDFTLAECLRAKAREGPHGMGFWQFMVTRFMPSRGIEPKPNPKILGQFDWLTKAMLWRVYKGDYYDHELASRGEAGQRAVICVTPAGGDELLAGETIGFQGYEDVDEAYAAIQEFQRKGFPKHAITTDWIECFVADEFGEPLEKPIDRRPEESDATLPSP